jgi:hypothetical protein
VRAEYEWSASQRKLGGVTGLQRVWQARAATSTHATSSSTYDEALFSRR